MSLKNPVTPPGMGSETVRLVAQRLNHYAAPAPPPQYIYIYIYILTCGAATQRGQRPPNSWGFHITFNDVPQSVGLLWTRDQSVAETCTSQHTILTMDIHETGGIRNRSLSRRAAADLRLRPCDHWDRQKHTHTHTCVCVCVYTGCFTTWEHYCRRWFPKS